MTDQEVELLKSILPSEMEIIHYRERPGGHGREGILRWKVGVLPDRYIDVPLSSNPIENQITILTNKAIEYGEQRGRKWASDQLKEVMKW